MITQNSNLTQFVKIYKNALSDSKCEYILKNSENMSWNQHSWANYKSAVPTTNDSTEFYRTSVTGLLPVVINPVVKDCLTQYTNEEKLFLINGVSAGNLNKYDANTKMKPHVDHIYTVFDGAKRGIPILTILILLNNNFEGGEFILWEDYKIDFNQGDVLIFPSLFMYKHRVEMVTKGIRYSYVAWAY